jgi:hypothetical protein
MSRVCLLLILAAFAAGLAAMPDFPRRAMALNMFADNAEPEPQITPREGRSSAAFWITPSMRFMADPTAVLVGVGGEGSHFFGERIGLMFAAGLWDVRVQAKKDGSYKRRAAIMVELEAGPRVIVHEWRYGAIYGDMRLGLLLADGQAPVRSTTSLGAGAHFGFEFGGSDVRMLIEAGLSWRGALNHSDAGWLQVDNRNGPGGASYDLLRFGLRVYL